MDTNRVTVFCPLCNAKQKAKFPPGTRVRIDPHPDYPRASVRFGVVTSAGPRPKTLSVLPDGEEYARYAIPERRVHRE